jgi:hypothetical protein
MIPALFLSCALAPQPAYVGHPSQQVIHNVYKVLVKGANQMGYLLGPRTHRILSVGHDEAMRVGYINRTQTFYLLGRLFAAPFQSKTFTFIVYDRELPRRESFWNLTFQTHRILMEGGFFFVEFDKFLNSLLEHNGFMRLPFSIGPWYIYQKLDVDNHGVRNGEEQRALNIGA